VILGNEDVISSDLTPRPRISSIPRFRGRADFAEEADAPGGARTGAEGHSESSAELHHWNRKQAARALSISYRALLYKIRDAGLPSNRTNWSKKFAR
jgi:DNA-binding NtrC family response regulator